MNKLKHENIEYVPNGYGKLTLKGGWYLSG
jgi:hypothetical protein